MADDVDYNDVLDSIVLGEETQHKQSYEEGFKAGQEAGNPEGFHLGYHRGAEIGRELGYYYGIVTHYIETNETSDTKYSEKLINQLMKVKELIDTFPHENSEEHDILGMAETIRAQYKKACAMLKISSGNPFDAGMWYLKMDTTISKIHQSLDSILRYLTSKLPIANCHMVEFLTVNYWDNLLPKPLKTSLESMSLNDAVSCFWKNVTECENLGNPELSSWVQTARAHCISVNNEYCLSRDQFQERITSWGGAIQSEIKVKEFMSSKKSYEVQTMSNLVAALHHLCKSTCCIEAGGGRGPLLATLSLSYGVPSLTIDCNESAVRAAQDRTKRMKKQWRAIARRLDDTDHEKQIVHIENLHRFASAYVTSDSDLCAIAKECFPEINDMKMLLTGLHTCGNLGPDSLRIFSAQPQAAAVFNVPCCYHLLTEEVDESLFDCFQRDFGLGEQREGHAGFPMSEYLRGVNLGRNARMLAAQSIDRVTHLQQLPSKGLLYRAMLQVLVKRHLPNINLSEGKLKRVSSKCENFEQYFKMADSILQLNLFETLSENDYYLKDLSDSMDDYWKKLVLFYLLRLCLAQVIESVILLDRLLFLVEHGFEKVFLVKLFDPVLSPRCYSIVAVR